jgi:hypothetical protein
MGATKSKEHRYHVAWEIDVWASSPQLAALKARKCQTAADTTAVVFEVTAKGSKKAVRVDLLDWE